jgi:hypothetical protein
VGNTADWETYIALWVQNARIDAFALYMAYGNSTNGVQVPLAFAAAVAKGLWIFFSFDYTSNGAWLQADVLVFLNAHISSSAYYHSSGKPFVSIFEGLVTAGNWADIKTGANCLFNLDYSSPGVKQALLAGGEKSNRWPV